MGFPDNLDPRLVSAMAFLLVFLVVVVIGYVIRGVLLRKVTTWAEKTKSSADDIVIAAVSGPSTIWIVMLGLYVALQYHPLSDRLQNMLDKVMLAAGLLSLTWALSSLATQMIRKHAEALDGAGTSTSLIQNLVRIVIWTTGIMVILGSFGISVGPMLATLGVGGLAVALALQDTLANLFAGVHISLNKIVRIGDYVRLESGSEGYVTDINWRTTTIRNGANFMVLVPNSKITQSIVTNFYYPSKDMSIVVPVGVHYSSDLKKVERITCEVAREVLLQVQGGVKDFEPVVRYHTLGDFSIQFNVVLRISEYGDQYLLKHEFIKRLMDRYEKEGIVIPYPVQAINTSQEGGQR
jgi:small-conductance mechanosensitive channel